MKNIRIFAKGLQRMRQPWRAVCQESGGRGVWWKKHQIIKDKQKKARHKSGF